MSNYRYVIDSTFQPFTFQEMLAPYVVYKEAADKAEEHYIDLANKAGKFKALAEYLPEGSRAKALYEGYANDLETQAADFGKNGLTMMNKAALTDLRSRYAGEIGQLDTAQTKLDEIMKTRNALAAAGKPMLYGNATPSIDDFLPGSEFNNYAVSTDDLYARGALAGKAASSRIYSVDGSQKTMGGMYYDFVVRKGWSAEHFRDFMMTNPEMQEAVAGILREKMADTNLKDPASMKAAVQAAVNGFIDGAVTEETHNPQRDLRTPTWAEERNDYWKGKEFALDTAKFALEQEKLALEKAKAEAKGDGIKPNPSYIFSQRERTQATKAMDDFSKYFVMKDGELKLTKQGLQEYNSPNRTVDWISSHEAKNSKPDARSPFKVFVDDVLKVGDAMKNKNYSAVVGAWNNYIQEHNGEAPTLDATRRMELKYSLKPSEYKKAKSLIAENATSGKLREIDMDDKQGVFTYTGDELKVSDLLKDDYIIVGIRASGYGRDGRGNSVMVQTPKGIKRYELPKGINSTDEEALAVELDIMRQIQDRAAHGVPSGGGRVPMTEEQRQRDLQNYKIAMNRAHQLLGQLFIANESEDQKTESLVY